MLIGDRQRNCPGAGADVEHRRLPVGTKESETTLHDDLCLRPRDERARIGPQRQPSKSPGSEDVRERLAVPPSLEQLIEDVRHVSVGLREDLGTRHPEDVCNEPLGVDTRRLHARVGEPLFGDLQRFRDGHSPSARRRSSAVSAAVNSSSSPCRTRSSWCTVSLMRWSVMRFSGKLYVRIFSARSPEPICERLDASSSACCFSRSSSYSRARRTRNAFWRFCSWLFSSCIETTSPVGRCVIRTAESVVFTLWPPGPVDR